MRLPKIRIVLTCLLALSVMALGLGPARSGGPGAWSRVTDTTGASPDELGLARSNGGTLHVAWVARGTAGTGEALMHTSISPAGVVGVAIPIVSGWQRVSGTPELLVAPDGSLRVFFGGTESTNPGEQNTNLNTATAPADGSTWTVQQTNVAQGSGQFGGEVGATVSPDGTYFQASSSTFVHRGLDANSPNFDYQAQLGGCCGYGPELVTDTETGQVHVGWYSSATSNQGVWVQEVTQSTGAPQGTPLQMPGSVDEFNGGPASTNPLSRTAMAARVGGGIYVAFATGYPAVDTVRVWKVGATTSTVVARAPDLRAQVAVAAAPDGRIWVVWARTNGGRPQVFASISNDSVTAWSPAASVLTPKEDLARQLYHLQADAQAKKTDIFVSLSVNSGPGTAFFHTQMLAPLEWTAGNDTLAGTAGSDFIYGGPGDDKLSGKGGRDDLYGGDGNDVLNGGPGKDKLIGGKGKDTCIFTTGDKLSGCERARRNH